MKKLQIKQHPENLVRRLEILVETDKVWLPLFNILKDADELLLMNFPRRKFNFLLYVQCPAD